MSFSALQRAEIAEIEVSRLFPSQSRSFSALQRAEIAEIWQNDFGVWLADCFSALQRAEIAEIVLAAQWQRRGDWFQCSSTSRNC